MRKFFQDRVKLVNELITSGPEVAYADLILILTAVISGCAASRWKGEKIDRNRFVELLVRHTPPEFHCDYVCVAGLLDSGLIDESQTPWGQPGESTRIFTDDEIDLDLNDARRKYPNLTVKELKNHSFASLIYKWLRCAYSHEYASPSSATHFPPSRDKARISYIGRIINNDGDIRRMTVFHLEYLIELATYHANNVSDSPQSKPDWWLQE